MQQVRPQYHISITVITSYQSMQNAHATLKTNKEANQLSETKYGSINTITVTESVNVSQSNSKCMKWQAHVCPISPTQPPPPQLPPLGGLSQQHEEEVWRGMGGFFQTLWTENNDRSC